jgi:hypothetical protein
MDQQALCQRSISAAGAFKVLAKFEKYSQLGLVTDD